MTIDSYLLDLERRLPRSARLRALAEVREHLRDAAARHRAAGASPGEAERLATADFGPVEEVAHRLDSELAIRETRLAAAVALVATVFFVIPLYVIPESSNPPAPWIELPSDLLSLQRLVLGLWLAAGLAATVSAVLAWRDRPARVAHGLIGASAAIAGAIATCVVLVIRWHSYTPATPNWALAAPLAAACIVTCVAAAAWSFSRRRLLERC